MTRFWLALVMGAEQSAHVLVTPGKLPLMLLSRVKMSRVNQLLAVADYDRWCRWRSAMMQVWSAGDVVVGVTKDLEISLFTTQDSTKVPDAYELSEALIQADRYARREAARTALTA